MVGRRSGFLLRFGHFSSSGFSCPLLGHQSDRQSHQCHDIVWYWGFPRLGMMLMTIPLRIQVHSLRIQVHSLKLTGPPYTKLQKERMEIFQPSIFRGEHLSFREGICPKGCPLQSYSGDWIGTINPSLGKRSWFLGIIDTREISLMASVHASVEWILEMVMGQKNPQKCKIKPKTTTRVKSADRIRQLFFFVWYVLHVNLHVHIVISAIKCYQKYLQVCLQYLCGLCLDLRVNQNKDA